MPPPPLLRPQSRDPLAGTVLGAPIAIPEYPTDPRLIELGMSPTHSGVMDPRAIPPFLRTPQTPPSVEPMPMPEPPRDAAARQPVPFLRSLETGQPLQAPVPPQVDPTTAFAQSVEFDLPDRPLLLRPSPGAPNPPPAVAPLDVGQMPQQRPRFMPRPRRPEEAAAPAPEVDSLGRPLSPDLVDGMTQSRAPMWQDAPETAYDRERRAIGIAEGMAQQRSEMLARQGAEQADILAAANDRAAQLEAERVDEEGRARQRYADSVNRLSVMEVEPARYWQRAGGFGIVGNAIAVALGALGEAFGGGPNTTLQTISDLIGRDINAQEQDIATAGRVAGERRGILAEVQQDFATRRGALEATRAMMLAQAAAEAEAQAAALGTSEAAQNGRILRDRLLSQSEQAAAEAQREEVRAQLQMRRDLASIRLNEARALREERRAMGGGGAARPERRTAPQLAAFDAQVASGVPRQEAWTSAGLSGVAPEGNPITTEQRAPLDALDAALREVESLVPAEGDIEGAGTIDSLIPAFLQSDRGLRLNVALNDMIDLYGRVRSGAAITEGEREAFRRNLIGSGTERELRVGLAQLRREISARLGRGGARMGGGQVIDQAIGDTGVRQVIEE